MFILHYFPGLLNLSHGASDVTHNVNGVDYVRVTTDDTFTWGEAHKECHGRNMMMVVFHDKATYDAVEAAFGSESVTLETSSSLIFLSCFTLLYLI